MKSRTKKLLIIIPFIIAALFLGFGFYMGHSIDTYTKVTLEEVYIDPVRCEYYGIGKNTDPKGYGYKDCSTIEYYSKGDNIKLNAWYIPSTKKNNDKCLLMFHGRDDNRLKSLKFTPVLVQYKVDSEYSICMADLRNAGKSENGRSGMGYKTAEDVYYTILFLNKTYGMKHFTLHTLSMGAMSTCVMLNNKQMMNNLGKEGITIDRIIFDSPLSNVYNTLYFNGTVTKHMPAFLVATGLAFFDRKVEGYLPQMRLSVLYKNISIPLLILQAKDDPKTPYSILMSELSLFKNPAIKLVVFEKGLHVKSFDNPDNKALYAKSVGEFLMGK